MKLVVENTRQFKKFVPAIRNTVVINDDLKDRKLKNNGEFKLPYDSCFLNFKDSSILLYYTKDGLGFVTIYKSTNKTGNTRITGGLVTEDLNVDMQLTFTDFVTKKKRNVVKTFQQNQRMNSSEIQIQNNSIRILQLAIDMISK